MNNKHGKYYYGKPEAGQFDHVIDAFVAHESVHSVKTSSLPLVQFWHDKFVKRNIDQIKGADGLTGEELRKIKHIFLDEDSLRCFEYATCVHEKCGGRGKASMTDLMLLTKGSNGNYKVAIEAKFTEYQEDLQYRPTVKMWKSEKSSKKDGGQNREKVLEGWCKYVMETTLPSTLHMWDVGVEEVASLPSIDGEARRRGLCFVVVKTIETYDVSDGEYLPNIHEISAYERALALIRTEGHLTHSMAQREFGLSFQEADALMERLVIEGVLRESVEEDADRRFEVDWDVIPRGPKLRI